MTTLRVLSYNVRGLRDDVDALTRVVTGAGAHLVVIQEAPKLFRWRSRCAELARRCGLVVVAGGGDAAGNLLLTSVAVRVHATKSVRLPLTPGHQFRGAAMAHLSLGGAGFTAVGTHLSRVPSERAWQVPRLLDEVPAGDAPLILAGDLNTEPGGAVWSALGARLEDAAGDDATPTFSCANPRRRIDGIFVDRTVKVAAYQVLDSPDVRRASDHFPVYAELELPA